MNHTFTYRTLHRSRTSTFTSYIEAQLLNFDDDPTYYDSHYEPEPIILGARLSNTGHGQLLPIFHNS